MNIPSKEHIEKHSSLELMFFRLLKSVGKRLYKAWNAYAGTQELKESFTIWMTRSPGDRLSDQEIARYSNDYIYERPSPEFIANPDLTSEPQQKIVPLLERVIESDPSIRKVLNIGCYIGRLDYYLARKYPHIEFIGIDFWADLTEANVGLMPPNRKVLRGYALDIIEARQADADLTFFFSTAARIKNAELRRYLRALKSKYVVMNEPNFRLPTGEILNPDEIDPKTSAPTRKYPIHAGDMAGGHPPCLTHNYRALLKDAGFSVPYFQSTHNPSRIELVATK
jgi:SAM-dependent methyltransferase